nr:MAG TPA: hypothetical protein [Caudoviricetes sp.]
MMCGAKINMTFKSHALTYYKLGAFCINSA